MKNTSEGKEQRNIKVFVYLDEYKMYSISSQIFEGITEYLISSREEQNIEDEQQKGSIFSGRKLADILNRVEKVEEKTSSRPKEPPPQSLTDPDVSLSAHPAPIDQPQVVRQSSSEQINPVVDVQYVPTNVLPDVSLSSAF